MDTEINAVMDKSGSIFFKSIDILSILGYKKPAEAVRTHVPDAISLDVLLNKNGNTMDVRVIPFPTNAKMLSPKQVFHLLSKIRRPNKRFNEWFQNILHKPLVCNEDMDFLRKVNFDYHCVKPRFTLHPEGGVQLSDLCTELFTLKTEAQEEEEIDVKPELLDISVEAKTSIGVNTVISNPLLVFL